MTSLELVETPRFVLELDEEAILAAGGVVAREIIREKIQASGHVASGEFLDSITVSIEDGGIVVGPEDETNQIKAKVFAKRGEDLITLTEWELEQVSEAMQKELDRQINGGTARVE